MSATYKTIAPSKLTTGMIVRRNYGQNQHHYKVVGIIRKIHDRKTFTFAQCEPVDGAPQLNPAIYTSKTKPIVLVS